MTRPILDLVSLADLARELDMEPRRLLRQLQSINAQCHGLAIVQRPRKPGSRKGGQIMVNRAVLGLDVRALTARVDELEGYARSLDARVSDVEARVA